MNLRRPNASTATDTFNRSRNVVPCSGLCVECLDGCKGGCEMWLASFHGREVIYLGPFGQITAGADKNYPLDYSHLNIQGYAGAASCTIRVWPMNTLPLVIMDRTDVVLQVRTVYLLPTCLRTYVDKTPGECWNAS